MRVHGNHGPYIVLVAPMTPFEEEQMRAIREDFDVVAEDSPRRRFGKLIPVIVIAVGIGGLLVAAAVGLTALALMVRYCDKPAARFTMARRRVSDDTGRVRRSTMVRSGDQPSRPLQHRNNRRSGGVYIAHRYGG